MHVYPHEPSRPDLGPIWDPTKNRITRLEGPPAFFQSVLTSCHVLEHQDAAREVVVGRHFASVDQSPIFGETTTVAVVLSPMRVFTALPL